MFLGRTWQRRWDRARDWSSDPWDADRSIPEATSSCWGPSRSRFPGLGSRPHSCLWVVPAGLLKLPCSLVPSLISLENGPLRTHVPLPVHCPGKAGRSQPDCKAQVVRWRGSVTLGYLTSVSSTLRGSGSKAPHGKYLTMCVAHRRCSVDRCSKSRCGVQILPRPEASTV